MLFVKQGFTFTTSHMCTFVCLIIFKATEKSEPHIHFKAEQTKNGFDLSSIMSCDHRAYCVQIVLVLSGVSTFKNSKQ